MFSEYQKKTIKASMVSNVAALNLMRLKKKRNLFSFSANDLLTVSGEYYYLLLLAALW